MRVLTILWALAALVMPVAAGAQAQPGTAFTTGGAHGEEDFGVGVDVFADLSFVAQGTPTDAWGHYNFEGGPAGFGGTDPFFAKDRVTCHFQVGNVAIFGGPAEKTNRPDIGSWSFTVTDNGEGASSPPDTFALTAYVFANNGCAGGTQPFEVDRGNIQIHDGLLSFSALDALLADL